MLNKSERIGSITLVNEIFDGEDTKHIGKLANKITEEYEAIVLFAVNLIFNSSKDMKKVNMSDILKDTITLIDGRGGGNQFAAQGGGKNNGNTEVAIDYATNKIRNILL